MSQIALERLIVLCPKIEDSIEGFLKEDYSVSPICQTRPYMRCCYISFNNFKIELLEMDRNNLSSKQFPLYEVAVNLTVTRFVGIGYMTDDLEKARITCKNIGIHFKEEYLSPKLNSTGGFRHRSFMIDLDYNDQYIYISQYDPDYYNNREMQIIPNKSARFFIEIDLPDAFYHLQASPLPSTKLRNEQNVLHIPVKENATSPVSWIQFQN